MEIMKFNPEKNEHKEKGRNVRVRSFYFRHAEKESGKVADGGEIPSSSLSEKGEKDSKKLGDQLPKPLKDGYKISWSGVGRTLETGEAEVGSYLGGEQRKEFKTRKHLHLAGRQPKEFMELYIKKWDAEKDKIMEQEGMPKEQFDKLSQERQAEIAEKAEEPVIREWINDEDSKLSKLYSVEDAAAQMAVYVRRKALKMPEELKSGSEVDLFGFTHKTITEPLLMKILILENGENPSMLEDLGGSLGLNEGWEVDSSIDGDGNKDMKFFLYRVDRESGRPEYRKKEYKIDLDELNRLADIGLRSHKNSEE